MLYSKLAPIAVVVVMALFDTVSSAPAPTLSAASELPGSYNWGCVRFMDCTITIHKQHAYDSATDGIVDDLVRTITQERSRAPVVSVTWGPENANDATQKITGATIWRAKVNLFEHDDANQGRFKLSTAATSKISTSTMTVDNCRWDNAVKCRY